MQEDFCDYGTSKILKKLRFDKPCLSYYLTKNNPNYGKKGTVLFCAISGAKIDWNDGINKDRMSRPTWQQIKRWVWEKHKWALTVRMIGRGVNFTYEIWNNKSKCFIEYGVKYNSPIEAEIEGIKHAVFYIRVK